MLTNFFLHKCHFTCMLGSKSPDAVILIDWLYSPISPNKHLKIYTAMTSVKKRSPKKQGMGAFGRSQMPCFLVWVWVTWVCSVRENSSSYTFRITCTFV